VRLSVVGLVAGLVAGGAGKPPDFFILQEKFDFLY
jgi:hypothetical protein